MQINPVNSAVTAANGGAALNPRTEASAGQAEGAALNPASGKEIAYQEPGTIEEQLKDATERVKDFVQTINRNLSFSIDNDTEQLVVKVVDSGTKEVIRQIPSEEMLAIAKALDKVQGLFVQQKA